MLHANQRYFETVFTNPVSRDEPFRNMPQSIGANSLSSESNDTITTLSRLVIGDNVTELTINTDWTYDQQRPLPTQNNFVQLPSINARGALGCITSPIPMDIYTDRGRTEIYIVKAGTSLPSHTILSACTQSYTQMLLAKISVIRIKGNTLLNISPVIFAHPACHITCSSDQSLHQKAVINLEPGVNYNGTLYFASNSAGVELRGGMNFVKTLECGNIYKCKVRDFVCDTCRVKNQEHNKFENIKISRQYVTSDTEYLQGDQSESLTATPLNPARLLYRMAGQTRPSNVSIELSTPTSHRNSPSNSLLLLPRGSELMPVFTSFIDGIEGRAMSPSRNNHPRNHSHSPYQRPATDRRNRSRGIKRPELSLEDKKEAPEGTSEARLCKVCYAREVNTVIRPCKHALMCTVCAHDERVVSCPTCRVQIENIERVYF